METLQRVQHLNTGCHGQIIGRGVQLFIECDCKVVLVQVEKA